jgi:hypothetical protein
MAAIKRMTRVEVIKPILKCDMFPVSAEGDMSIVIPVGKQGDLYEDFKVRIWVWIDGEPHIYSLPSYKFKGVS